MKRPFLFAAFALLLACPPSPAQPAAPAPPARYNALLRYRITSARDQHVAHYDAMIAHLQKLGFEFDPPLDTFPETDREDRSKNTLTGTIAPNQILKVFGNRHIETLLLTRLPLKDLPTLAGPIKVRLELAPGFTPGRQHELAKQARLLLETLGFRESVGYDHRGYTGRPHTRLVGTIPGKNLTTLLKDLRQQLGGWFGPRIAAQDLPSPLRAVV
ncbi:MAG TPA: hypothetical protein VEL76_40510, partial [Gemmataceae bacterium]|nr:hypothetical protein [Gemmataceae bacterium]